MLGLPATVTIPDLMELTMASFLPHLLLAIQLNHSDKIFNFHAASLAQPHLDTQPETT